MILKNLWRWLLKPMQLSAVRSLQIPGRRSQILNYSKFPGLAMIFVHRNLCLKGFQSVIVMNMKDPLLNLYYVQCLSLRLVCGKLTRDFVVKVGAGDNRGTTLYHGEIRARTVGIIGYGHIGEAVAKRAAAFDMRVVGIRRSKQLTPPFLDWLGTSDRLDDLLRESDFVVVACDLNKETEGMIGAPQLALMKSDSVIINVARGRIIAEEPLYNALKNKEIGGAILDTWYNYIGPDKTGRVAFKFPLPGSG